MSNKVGYLDHRKSVTCMCKGIYSLPSLVCTLTSDCLSHCSFRGSLEIRCRVSLANLFLVFSVFTILDPLHFHVNCRDRLFFYRKACWDLVIGIALNLWINLGKNCLTRGKSMPVISLSDVLLQLQFIGCAHLKIKSRLSLSISDLCCCKWIFKNPLKNHI